MQSQTGLTPVQIERGASASNAGAIMNSLDLKSVGRRREFFRAGARYVVLGALGVASLVLARRGGWAPNKQTCVNRGICRGCGEFAACGLPAALSAKRG